MSTSAATLPKSAAQPLDIRAIYEHYVAVYATRDVEEIKKNHSIDSRFWLHNGGKPVVGRDAIAQTFAETFRLWPQTGFEVYRTIFHERGWILDWAMTAILKGPDGSDRPVRFDALDVVDVDEAGLVCRKDTFIDSTQVKAAFSAASA
jgi:ketosteroid isomerase-like protein